MPEYAVYAVWYFSRCFLVRFIHFGKSAHEKVQETHDKNMNNVKQCKENRNNATEIRKKCKWHVCAQDCVFKITLTVEAISKLAPCTDKWGIQTLASLKSLNSAKSLLWTGPLDFVMSKAWLQLIPCGWSCYRSFEFVLENIFKTNFWFIKIVSKFF